MAHIDALIEKITDPALRDALRVQVDNMLTKKSFGLVYQQHKPETVELPNYKVRRGCKVRIRSEDDQELYRVEKLKGSLATIVTLTDEPQRWDVETFDLVVVREFGETVYPGLTSVESLKLGGDKPAHVVINGENFHALETLLYTHEPILDAYKENSIDAIYIDPPYNTGDRNWKYNNDYVDGVDQYRHSKWLAFMERRLLLARRLLRSDGVLIVTIDEHEVNNLGVLLRQLLPDAAIQQVTIVINPKGNTQNLFSRVDEYAFFCFLGKKGVVDGPDSGLGELTGNDPVWTMLMRRGSNSLRTDRETMFYPIIVSTETETIVGAGAPLPLPAERTSVTPEPGTRFVWPIRTDQTDGRWQIGRDRFVEQLAEGTVKLGARGGIQYVPDKGRKGIKDGAVEVLGQAPDGSLRLRWANKMIRPKTVWFRSSHNAATYGTDMLTALLGARNQFPFPKSVYAVRDCLRAAIGDRPNAVILDFFAGSGTTMHAVALMNAEDGGRRQSILVTNNEVSNDEAKALKERGLAPGDDEWEHLGIFHHVIVPRIKAAVTGLTPQGAPVAGEYLESGFPLADGLVENVEFFELTYEDPDLVSLGRKFEVIAPLLWLKAGGRGAQISDVHTGWVLPDDAYYGILFDPDEWREFVEAVAARVEEIRHAFVVTNSESTFQQIVAELPRNIPSTQLYGDYLHTFEINTTGRS